MPARPSATSTVEEDLAQMAAAPETRTGVKKLRYTHDAMIDLIIANPGISQGELSRHFGLTSSWISIVLGSDVVQARLAARREQLVDPMIQMSLDERFKGIISRSLDVLAEKLDAPTKDIPDNLVVKAVELGIKATGMGQVPPPAPPPADHLFQLAERLTALQRNVRSPNVLDSQIQDVEAIEVLDGQPAASDSRPPDPPAQAAGNA